MKKILIIIEDYNENSRIQTVLMKIGFDVLSMANPAGLADKIIGFNPDVVVSSGSHKFTSIGLGQKLKEISHLKAKSVIVLPFGVYPQTSDLMKIKMDVLMEAPIMPQKLIEVIANLTGIDPAPILEKLKKAQLSDPQLGEISTPFAMPWRGSKVEDPVREKNYNNLVSMLPPIEKKATTFVKSDLKARQEEIEKSWDPKVTKSSNELRKQFVEALFKKK